MVDRETGKEGRRRKEETLREGSAKRRQGCVWHKAKVCLGEWKGRNLLEGGRRVSMTGGGDDELEQTIMIHFKSMRD